MLQHNAGFPLPRRRIRIKETCFGGHFLGASKCPYMRGRALTRGSFTLSTPCGLPRLGKFSTAGCCRKAIMHCPSSMPVGPLPTCSRCTPARRALRTGGRFLPPPAESPWPRRRPTCDADRLSNQAALARRRILAIRHVSGHHLVALLEILSPANKDRSQRVEEFAAKAVEALEAGVHMLVVDLFPPGPWDPQGIHGVIRQRLEQSDVPYDLPAEEPLTLASYAAGPSIDVYLEHLAVGAPLPEMPLFLSPERYVNVPLEATYRAAYEGMPRFWRDVLEGRSPA